MSRVAAKELSSGCRNVLGLFWSLLGRDFGSVWFPCNAFGAPAAKEAVLFGPDAQRAYIKFELSKLNSELSAKRSIPTLLTFAYLSQCQFVSKHDVVSSYPNGM
jgi:hypothetical protein